MAINVQVVRPGSVRSTSYGLPVMYDEQDVRESVSRG